MKIRVKFCERVNYDVSVEIPKKDLQLFDLDPYGYLEEYFFELLEAQKPDWSRASHVNEREVTDYEEEANENQES